MRMRALKCYYKISEHDVLQYLSRRPETKTVRLF